MQTEIDFTVEDHGTVWSFTPRSRAALTVVPRLCLDGWQRLGRTFVVDHRPAADLVERLRADGLVVAPA
jgi:hypothetical protein